ncbi:MAG: ribosomal RNA small subunit methyltransferase A [Candidatus Kerfeldbacteria bacterium RIFOXYA2_FULL_38_24]|uniref:Ribosomal RNA small subunit methyltransferase A n=1 Tax=Candidatus Kerfeldbacteria bacterium RIFOXYB2_FULL_38_14 TaxID=1798547 RepID=A0A1G2BEG2_9BACT|nr:MAG: ribosomal RNA small subunit methyltransferase A [Candidatus Kerfeldbacteria bacterium RIFOXYA2_FULL_38_24]OGY86949.1 MAG: ribosomal RNA small subunit methyltransferase A [Candidatus Kerfeldbacteria bacterium RIFOXYB2_FULL_38_14]
MTKEQLKFLLKKYKIFPRKEQGQNFLLDDQIIKDIIAVSNLSKDDTILEIGPGFGVLTLALAQKTKKVLAIEQDRNIYPAMLALSRQQKNIFPFNQSIQKFNLESADFKNQQYKLIANLPYSITSWVLQHFLEHHPQPGVMVIMVQKEVAERVIAVKGAMSILSCAVNLYADAEIMRLVAAECFYPAPKVMSAILKLTVRPQPKVKDPEKLMQIIKIGFSAKRKQLHHNLSAFFHFSPSKAKNILEKSQLGLNVRAQELSVEDWIRLQKNLV